MLFILSFCSWFYQLTKAPPTEQYRYWNAQDIFKMTSCKIKRRTIRTKIQATFPKKILQEDVRTFVFQQTFQEEKIINLSIGFLLINFFLYPSYIYFSVFFFSLCRTKRKKLLWYIANILLFFKASIPAGFDVSTFFSTSSLSYSRYFYK